MLRHIHTFDLFESKNDKPIATFDFDGLFHVGKYYELDSSKRVRGTPEDWGFSDKIGELLKKVAEQFKCIIVSKRPTSDVDDVTKFMNMHDAHPDDVYCVPTHVEKAEKIKELGSVRHYDDQMRVFNDLKNMGYSLDYYLMDDDQKFSLVK